MEKEKDRGKLTKRLAVAGTLLVWAPMAFTVLTSAVGTISEGRFLFDYLMPAELFPAALAGALLLLWTAKRSGLRFRVIGFGVVFTLFFLGAVMVIPSVTGLADGTTEPSGMPFVMVMACLALYVISLVSVGIGGILLWKDLYNKRK